MNQPSYPAASDLGTYLSNLGITIPAGIDLNAKVMAASSDFEYRVGWGPYLATSGPSVRYFDPPGVGPKAGIQSGVRGGKQLNLNAGLLDLTALAIGVVPGFPGTVLTPDLQFYLGHRNALEMGWPYTYVDFLTAVRGIPKSISIHGVWGCVDSVPYDVWDAILGYAAYKCTPEIMFSLTRGRKSVKTTDDIEYVFDPQLMKNLSDGWKCTFDALVETKKRV